MNTLLERTQKYISDNNLFTYNHKLLVAVSGGIDSMVLWDILKKLNYHFIVAHCNFQLRGEESNADEEFIRKKAFLENTTLKIIRFDTIVYASKLKLSIQETARKLRYDYFYELCSSEKCDFIVTAHNLDDRIETFFINLLRGTGLRGLCSIPVQNNKIVRPLLFCPRNDILNYAQLNRIEWREDSSNSEDKYLRNKIRHHIIPSLIEIKPDFYHIFSDNFQRLNAENKIIENILEYEILSNLFLYKNRIIIEKNKILRQEHLYSLFAYYLKQFRFTDKQVELLLSNKLQTGKVLKSSTHQIIVDRHRWILITNANTEVENDAEIFIYENTTNLVEPLTLKLSIIPIKNLENIPKSNLVACIDKQKLFFPLIIRKWKKGDSMIPLGMKGRKKISDILTGAKVSTVDRKNAYVIESNNEIVWLVGIRMSEKFKVTNETREVLLIELIRDDHDDDVRYHDRDYKPC